jgi:hypothetical protein
MSLLKQFMNNNHSSNAHESDRLEIRMKIVRHTVSYVSMTKNANGSSIIMESNNDDIIMCVAMQNDIVTKVNMKRSNTSFVNVFDIKKPNEQNKSDNSRKRKNEMDYDNALVKVKRQKLK